jgi:hypothetical protein
VTREGFPVAVVDGTTERRFVIDTEDVTWRTIPLTREGVDQFAAPGEQSLTNDNIWRRTRDDWILGAGQIHADIPDESDVLRFEASAGVSPWTRRELSLLADTTLVVGSASSARAHLEAVADAAGVVLAVFVHGTSVKAYSGLTGGTPVLEWNLTGAGAYTSITTDGQRLWLARGTGIDIIDFGDATPAIASFSSYTADVVAYANGRLLAADGNQLVEILGNGDDREIWAHPSARFAWVDVCSAPGGIYCFGDIGDRTEIYVVGAIDTTGELDVPFWAAALPDGEHLRAATFYGGVILLGTTRGIRLSLIGGGGFLSFGPVIEVDGGATCLEGQGEDVWYGYGAGSAGGIGRARLARFTAELVPAYTTDLALPTPGVAPTAIRTVGNLRVAAVPGLGLVSEHHERRARAGWVDLGAFSYGLSEPKVPDTLTVWSEPLPAGAELSATVRLDDGTEQSVTWSTVGASRHDVVLDDLGAAERIFVRVGLAITTDGDDDVSPIVNRVTLRATPQGHVSQSITLPLKLTDRVEDRGISSGLEPWDEWAWLEEILTSRRRVRLHVGEWSGPVRIDAIEVIKGGLGGGNGLAGWDDRGRFLRGDWEVTFTTLEEVAG